MKVPVKWLKEYVKIDLPLAELAERLTKAGIKIKGTEAFGDSWPGIVVSQVVDIKTHPNDDQLRLVTVNVGAKQQTVACGAPNLTLSDKVAFANVGGQLIDSHSGQEVSLKPATIGGIISSGKVCSEKELGISDSHKNVMVLPPVSPVGKPLADIMSDNVLGLEIPFKRPDLFSVIGIAREVATLTEQRVLLTDASYEEKGPPLAEKISVTVRNPRLCPRYCISLVEGIKIDESPWWLKSRLLASGIKPSYNIADIANYIMLEYGQPLFTFDYDKLSVKKIIVRRATADETIVTSDGVEWTPGGDTLVIADKERLLAVAGIMCGTSSEVGPETTSILLESASFNATSIGQASQHLHLTSEASKRFELGVSPELAIPALKRATQLVLELAGGEAAKGLVDVNAGKTRRKSFLLSKQKIREVLGPDISISQVTRVLTLSGFAWMLEEIGDDVDEYGLDVATEDIRVFAPYWRADIRQDVDILNEVSRIMAAMSPN